MTRAVQELKQIPFAHLIGAPMKAAVEAQALAAQSTIDFIHKVGFKHASPEGNADPLFADPAADADLGELRNVTFSYTKKDEGEGESASEVEYSLTVPLLAIVPIPYLRIDEMTIDFKAKLSDAISRNTNSSFQVDATVGASYSAFWSPVKMDVRVSSTYKTNSSTASSQKREYSMDIHVRAVQDEMPAGLSKMLDMLEDAIKDKKQA
ncbi:MAG: DUF2589 domain-containing protein [Sandaracinaceae bacterium]|nr:DUF2589 domain-containing protein [Sandaracinaceae bacterium]